MESWRQRGYVQDSDEEDEFDAKASQLGNHDPEQSEKTIQPSASPGAVKRDSRESSHPVVLVGAEFDVKVSEREPCSPDGQQKYEREYGIQDRGAGDVELNGDSNGVPSSIGNAAQILGVNKEAESQIVSSTLKRAEESSRFSISITVPVTNQPSTPPPRTPTDIWDIWDIRRSSASSPDELQAAFSPFRQPASPILKTVQVANVPNVSDHESSSPLSSVPPSPSPLNDAPIEDGEEDMPNRSANEQQNNFVHTDIQQDVLREINQPSRRSLRQRNPIQLHPYELEYARYQMLMKARGLKPLRLETFRHERSKLSDESQGQKSLEDPESQSSLASEFRIPPPSPGDRGATTTTINRHRSKQILYGDDRLQTVVGGRPTKRRKLLQHEVTDHKAFSHSHNSNAETGSSPPLDLENSIFDFPHSSPPDSSNVSSSQTEVPAVFRFPPGFMPPTLPTPVTEPNVKKVDATLLDAVDSPAKGIIEIYSDSESRNFPIHSNAESELETDNEEIIVRRLQRKIKGVLPASWLRLDLKKQEETRPKQHQRPRDSTSLRLENAKGVARKVARKVARTGRSGLLTGGPPKSGSSYFLDNGDTADDDNDHQNNKSTTDDIRGADQALASLLGFDESYEDYIGDDISVDNSMGDIGSPIAPHHSRFDTGSNRLNERQFERGKEVSRKLSLAEVVGFDELFEDYVGDGDSRDNRTDYTVSLASRRPLITLADNRILERQPSRRSEGNIRKQSRADSAGFDQIFDYDDLGSDIPEDNRIDYMAPATLPRRSRSRANSQNLKRRQFERDPVDSERQPRQPKRVRRKRQTRITDTLNRTQRVHNRSSTHKNSIKLSILDAPDVADRPRKEQPRFLRVAARQARSRRDRGRRSPTGKFLRLSTKDDTNDANKSLHAWRKGLIRQSDKTKASRSHSFAPQSLSDAIDDRQHEPVARSSRAEPRQTILDPENLGVAGEAITAAEAPRPSVVNTARLRISEPQSSANRHRAERLGNKWVVHRNFAVSSFSRNALRPAASNLQGIGRNNITSASIFEKSISSLNRDFRRLHGPKRPSLLLNRFLYGKRLPLSSSGQNRNGFDDKTTTSNNVAADIGHQHVQPRVRKRMPQRLDVVDDDHLGTSAVFIDDPEPSTSEAATATLGKTLDGLAALQTSYALDFGITPLGLGTFFHECTFIGSGEFLRSLRLSQRDMDGPSTPSSINLSNSIVRWGPWNDAVSSEMSSAIQSLLEGMEQEGEASLNKMLDELNSRGRQMLRSIINYVTNMLTFIDPVDRGSFVERGNALVSKLYDALKCVVSSEDDQRPLTWALISYILVFSNQVYQISGHSTVDRALAAEAMELVMAVSRGLLFGLFGQLGNMQIAKFLEENKSHDNRDRGVREDFPAVESLVIAQHVLQTSPVFDGCFESFVFESLLPPAIDDLMHFRNVQRLEETWRSLFTILPVCEIDQFGIARVGSRFKTVIQHWRIVKDLVTPVLGSYEIIPETQLELYNNYCRIVFRRCFHMINAWGWRDCKLILEVLFDFFAKNALYNLRNEESFGSPSFLDELDRDPSFDVQSGESCFHIFLKIVASGLRSMSKIHDERKLRNLAWRLLPNHGRVYPKEKPLRREDLAALRNHHDLLCTLYWVVPDGCRPRLQTIRDLVSPATSHLETLNISFRAWTRLVRFKLSTDEEVSGLGPFADWHGHFVAELLKQHSLARTEVEAQSNSDHRFSRQVIDKVISQNQRQIECLLSTALAGLKTAVEAAPHLSHAFVLLSKMPIKALLSLFNPRSARVNRVVSEALQVVLGYVRKTASSDAPAVLKMSHIPTSADEDSQEYGDWTEIEAMCEDEVVSSTPTEGIEFLYKTLHPTVFRLVSDCFGEDHCAEDSFLLSVVDCWTSIAQVLARQRLRHWDNYLNPFDGESWASLRSTVQTRKFTPQFLASCLEKDPRFFTECKTQILSIWMTTLVERTSLLKFQNRLTETLLNQDIGIPLLQNLPFSRDKKKDGYIITLDEFSQRRLSLISSLLSNMRDELQDAENFCLQGHSTTRREYRELLQKMMSSMKANYQELGNGTEAAQGAYVTFVHHVIGFLQQYTRDICSIDPFFTDPTSFPLPSSDPMYIVAKLKSYEPMLANENVAKALIMFVQGVSERAAIDNQQAYLVGQLCASMADTYESGDSSKPTLRAILLQSLFPAYLETMLSNAAAWILGLPMLQTISLVFRDLLFNIDLTDASCVDSILCILNSVFNASFRALRPLVKRPDMITDPAVLISVAAIVDMISSALPIIDYIDRATDAGENLLAQIQAFRQFTRWSASRLCQSNTPCFQDELFAKALDTDTTVTAQGGVSSAAPSYFERTRSLASKELQSYMNESWSRLGNNYYLIRRGAHRPQVISLDPALATRIDSLATEVLKSAVESFEDRLQALELDDESCMI